MVEKLWVNLEEEIIDGNKAPLLLPLLRDDNQVVGVDEHLAHLPLAVALLVRCLKFPDDGLGPQLLHVRPRLLLDRQLGHPPVVRQAVPELQASMRGLLQKRERK